MSDLISASSIVNDLFRQTNNDYYNEQQHTFIAIYRIRQSWHRFFQAFISVFNKIIEKDLEVSFYDEFIAFLTKKLCSSPWKMLYECLNQNSYDKKSVSKMIFSQSEKDLLESFPQNPKFLTILIFFLFQPILTQRFFMEHSIYLLSKPERNVLSYYQTLPPELQNRVFVYMEKLAEYSVLDKSKVNNI